jgi:hypothetical protein
MSEDRQPDSDPLETAIRAFQQLTVPERPPDAEVLARLGPDRDEPPEPGRSPVPFRRRYRVHLIASAAAAVLLLGGLVLILPDRRPTDPVRVAAVTPADTAPSPAVRPPEGKEGVVRAAVDSLEDRVKESQVILVATAETSAPAPPSEVPGDAPEVLIQFKVKRVLKGELTEKTITTRTSAPAEKIVGQDWVVWLTPEYVAGKHQYAALTAAKFEPKLKEILAKDKK